MIVHADKKKGSKKSMDLLNVTKTLLKDECLKAKRTHRSGSEIMLFLAKKIDSDVEFRRD